jgi:hypothetical protein
MTTAGTRAKSTGKRLALKGHQVIGFIDGGICPICKNPNIYYRSWREDYLCGYCKKVYRLIGNNVHLLGDQEDLD